MQAMSSRQQRLSGIGICAPYTPYQEPSALLRRRLGQRSPTGKDHGSEPLNPRVHCFRHDLPTTRRLYRSPVVRDPPPRPEPQVTLVPRPSRTLVMNTELKRQDKLSLVEPSTRFGRGYCDPTPPSYHARVGSTESTTMYPSSPDRESSVGLGPLETRVSGGRW